jgi:hypothetical protein
VRWLACCASLVLNATACLMWKSRKSFQPVLSSNRLIAFAAASIEGVLRRFASRRYSK